MPSLAERACAYLVAQTIGAKPGTSTSAWPIVRNANMTLARAALHTGDDEKTAKYFHACAEVEALPAKDLLEICRFLAHNRTLTESAGILYLQSFEQCAGLSEAPKLSEEIAALAHTTEEDTVEHLNAVHQLCSYLVREAPSLYWAAIGVGRALLSLGRPDEALEILTSIPPSDNLAPEATFLTARAHQYASRAEDALQVLRDGVDRCQSYKPFRLLLCKLALDSLEGILQQPPLPSPLEITAGDLSDWDPIQPELLQEAAEELAQFTAWLQQAEAEGDDFTESIFDLGRTFFFLGNFQDAVEVFGRCLSTEGYDEYQIRLWAGRSAFWARDYAEAQETLSDAILLEPDDQTGAQFLMLLLLLVQRNHGGLLSNAQELYGAGNHDVFLITITGIALCCQEKHSDAIVELKKMKLPNAAGFLWLEWAYYRAGRPAALVKTLRQHSQEYGKDYQAEFIRGCAFNRMGKWDSALRALEYASSAPSLTTRVRAETKAQVALALMQGGKRDQAAQTIQEGLELQPEHVRCLYLEGLLAARDGDLSTAATTWETVLKSDSSLDEARISLGVLAERDGNHKTAREFYLKAIKNGDLMSQGERRLGILSYKDGQAEDAAQWLRKAQSSGDTSSELLTCLGRVSYETGNYQDSIDCWKNLLTGSHSDPHLRSGLALAYKALGLGLSKEKSYGEARDAWDQALSYAPDDQQLHALIADNEIQLGWLQFSHSRTTKEAAVEAVERFKSAAASNPHDTRAPVYLALATWRAGKDVTSVQLSQDLTADHWHTQLCYALAGAIDGAESKKTARTLVSKMIKDGNGAMPAWARYSMRVIGSHLAVADEDWPNAARLIGSSLSEWVELSSNADATFAPELLKESFSESDDNARWKASTCNCHGCTQVAGSSCPLCASNYCQEHLPAKKKAVCAVCFRKLLTSLLAVSIRSSDLEGVSDALNKMPKWPPK